MTQFGKAITFECPDQLSDSLTMPDVETVSKIAFHPLSNIANLPDDVAIPETIPLWERFCRWVTSTENRIYVGWFGIIMFPTLSTAAIVFVLALIATPAVDMDGTGRMISGALLDGNNVIVAAVVPTSAAIGLHF